MDKKDALQMLMLLSAIESWSLVDNHKLPDYLHENLSETMEKLAKLVLETKT